MSENRLPAVISLGAGVQSTTLALLAAHGEVEPMPVCAIFADTQAEPASVYRHLDWLMSDVLPFPILRVTKGSLIETIGKTTGKTTGKLTWPALPIPAFVAGSNGHPAMLNRSCTRDFKIRPIHKKLRELLGLTRRKAPSTPIVEQWIGISCDEAHRMKDSREPWLMSRWPLIELGMTRADCLDWLEARGYPRPPKSSCTFCPYHSGKQWQATKADPEAWAQAVEIDERIRDLWSDRVSGGIYLHRSMTPLASAIVDDGPDLWGNECEGVCGV